jgi:hypothetical protein
MRDEPPRSRRAARIEDPADDVDAEVPAKPRARKPVKSSVSVSEAPPRSRRSKAPPKSSIPVVEMSDAAPAPRASRSPPRPKAKGARSRKKPGAGGALDVDAERFFAEGATGPGPAGHESDISALGVPPAVPLARRQAFLRVVGLAIGFSTLVCLAALAISSARSAAPPPVAALVVPQPPPAAAPVVAAPPPVVADVPPSPTPPPIASAAPALEPSAAAAPEPPAKSAVEEKGDARRALERGRIQEARAAAERSTALDPTDADAWLLLGASSLELGKSADARAAFSSCLKSATKGPVGECRSMLR